MIKSPAHVENNNQQRLVPRDVAAARLRRMRKLGRVLVKRDVETGVTDVTTARRYYEMRGEWFTWAVRTYAPVRFAG